MIENTDYPGQPGDRLDRHNHPVACCCRWRHNPAAVTPDNELGNERIPCPLCQVHGPQPAPVGVEITDEAVRSAAPEIMVRYRGKRTPDNFALEATRSALEAACPFMTSRHT